MKQTIFAAGLIVFAWAAFGQSSDKPMFEAASVKPAPPPTGMGLMVRMGGDAGRINWNNVALKDMIAQAYDVKDFQISGPEWLRSARFDVVATMPEGTTPEQRRLMLQNLLAERFQLSTHRESKDMQIFALVVTKGGPKIKPSEVQVEAKGGRMMFGPEGLECKQMAMSGLAQMLARQMARPVLDMTELKGVYDFKLKYTMDEGMRGNMMAGMPPPPPRPDGGGEKAEARGQENGPSIFAAVQEQLGLKLEARKGPMDILVVDHAEKVPTEN